MRVLKRVIISIIVFSMLYSFSVFAMNNTYNFPQPARPLTEKKHEDSTLDYRWTWVNDELCVRFQLSENVKKERIGKMWDTGAISRWTENDKPKKRDTYAGKWSQNDDGIWSFVFDDGTIPVGVTKIDDLLYAFNGYGELKEGYEYYDGLKTGVDGLVVTDNADLNKWIETEYLPSCTSHKE